MKNTKTETTAKTTTTTAPAPEKKKESKINIEEITVPEGFEVNIYDLSKAMLTGYKQGARSAFSMKDAKANGVSPVMLKAWMHDCDQLLGEVEIYIRAKHENPPEEATAIRNALSEKVLAMFNRHFVKDKNGFYEFNANDVENVIAAAEKWERNGLRIDGANMPVNNVIVIAKSEAFRAEIERLFCFKITGGKVMTNERRDALEDLRAIKTAVSRAQKSLNDIQGKISLYEDIVKSTTDKKLKEKFTSVVTPLKKEAEKLEAEIAEGTKKLKEAAAKVPQ